MLFPFSWQWFILLLSDSVLPSGWTDRADSPLADNLAEPIDKNVSFSTPAQKEQVAADFSCSGGSSCQGSNA